MQLVIVRHAHAGSRRAWEDDDRLRPLSEKGSLQAKRLAEMLSRYEPARLLSSPAVRCTQTLQPLADDLGLEIDPDVRLLEGAGFDQVDSLLDEVADTGLTTVVSTHGDVVPLLLQRLVDQGMEPDAPLMWKKASAWIIEREDGSWGTGAYWHEA